MLARLHLSGACAPKFDISKSRSNAMANFCAAVVECLGTFRPRHLLITNNANCLIMSGIMEIGLNCLTRKLQCLYVSIIEFTIWEHQNMAPRPPPSSHILHILIFHFPSMLSLLSALRGFTSLNSYVSLPSIFLTTFVKGMMAVSRRSISMYTTYFVAVCTGIPWYICTYQPQPLEKTKLVHWDDYSRNPNGLLSVPIVHFRNSSAPHALRYYFDGLVPSADAVY
jgi:hypothetical protein